jgi:hypothetical protein
MTISIVSGYVCENSCDVAKAKKGEDPHPQTHASTGATGASAAAPLDRPAVIFGGSLAALSAGAIAPTGNASTTNQVTTRSANALDLLV